ncbi:MAG: Uma2 family endonuclease [Myxococcota bacterium]
MAGVASSKATYDDVLAAPAHVLAELVDGELHTLPRPAVRHAMASSALGGELNGPFNRGKGGPGGWIILNEPEIHLAGDVLVPNLAGWRRATLPELPDARFLDVRPDWVCEILSPSTRAHDRVRKMPIYAREGVSHVWLIDADVQLLEVYRLDGETYRLVATCDGDASVRLEPFDAIELDLAALWMR